MLVDFNGLSIKPELVIGIKAVTGDLKIFIENDESPFIIRYNNKKDAEKARVELTKKINMHSDLG